MENSQVYTILRDKQEMDYYTNIIFEITHVMPAQCYMVNSDTGLYIRYLQGTDMNIINGANNLRKLKELGIMPKLSPKQIEENTIFVNSAPKKIFTMTSEELTIQINTDNKNIIALNSFVPPPKIQNQNLGSIKITLSTRNMVHSALSYGIRILGCIMEPHNIKQGHYLKVPQCTFCYRFHNTRACEHINPSCPNCAQKHRRFQCPNKEGPWRCINCKGQHKATSNYCPDRSGLLSEEPLGDINQSTLVCPFGEVITNNNEYIPAPQPKTSAWNRNIEPNGIQIQEGSTPPQNHPQTPQQAPTPLTNYHDCLRMALLYENWYPAFLILQPLLGLTRIELPEALRYNISIQESDILAPQPPPPTGEHNSYTRRENYTRPNNIQQNESTPGFNRGPLTGANALPIARKEIKTTQRPPLLPTPSDPFEIPSYQQLKQGAIPKRKKTATENQYRTETSNRFAPLAMEEELFNDCNIIDEDERKFPSSSPVKKPPLPKREVKLKQNRDPSGAHPNQKTNKVEHPTTKSPHTSSNFPEDEDEELPSFWNTQDSINAKSKLSPKISTLIREEKDSTKTKIQTYSTPPREDISFTVRQEKEGEEKLESLIKTQDAQREATNKEYSTTQQKPKDDTKPKGNNRDRLSMSQPLMSTIKELTEPINKIPSTQASKTSKEKTGEDQKTQSNDIQTEKLPLHIVTRTPPDRRHTMGPSQFKSVVESFQNLSNANERTARKIYTEVKKAEQIYIQTKKDYLKTTTNPIILQQVKDKTTSQNQPIKETIETEPQEKEQQENIKFEMGVSGSPPPKIRKHYKHPSPPQDNSLPQEPETTSTNEKDPNTDSIENIPKSTRLLRSNSTSHTKL